VALLEVQIKDVRNISSITFHPSLKLNIIAGPNGSGKTSLLEALYLLSRARSFRTQNIKKVISNNKEHLIVYAKIKQQDVENKVAIKKSTTETQIRVNGKTEKKSSELSRYLHTHLIRPESQTLLERGSTARRSFVDWGVFHVKHEFLQTAKKYNQLLKQRNKLLKSKKLETLGAWDKKLVEYGIIITKERKKCVVLLEDELKLITHDLMGEVNIKLVFLNGWSNEVEFEESLSKNLNRDTLYGYTTTGPHKSDMQVLIDNKPAQDFLSRGQMKLLVISLYLAQIKITSQYKGKPICVLLDDLAAELDVDSLKKVMVFLDKLSVQVFITTTKKELFKSYIEDNEANVFHVKHGGMDPGEI